MSTARRATSRLRFNQVRGRAGVCGQSAAARFRAHSASGNVPAPSGCASPAAARVFKPRAHPPHPPCANPARSLLICRPFIPTLAHYARRRQPHCGVDRGRSADGGGRAREAARSVVEGLRLLAAGLPRRRVVHPRQQQPLLWCVVRVARAACLARLSLRV